VIGAASGAVVGSGDFNGDGRDDILTRSAAGAITVYLGLASGQFTAFAPTQQLLDLSWKIAQIGDFNGDGRDDLVWRNGGGLGGEWLGTATGDFANNGFIPTIDTSWTIQSPDLFVV
jgi:FG-GAP-like repeat